MKPLVPIPLDRYDASCRPINGLEPLGNAGGFSGARLWRYNSPRGLLVLRCWPYPGPDPSEIEQVHAWLLIASDLGFIPMPIATRDRRTFLESDGRLWELAPWMPGSADLRRPPSSDHLRLMFAGLATFHVRLGRQAIDGPSPGLMARAQELDHLIQTEFSVLKFAIDRAPSDEISSLAGCWMERVRRHSARILDEIRKAAVLRLATQPCLRDARPDHFLFDQDRLTGLVDFGAMGWEFVSADIGRLLGETVGEDRVARANALRSYESVRPLTGTEIRLIAVFERANAVLGPARWVRWHFLESRAFDVPNAVLNGLRRGHERLDAAGL